MYTFPDLNVLALIAVGIFGISLLVLALRQAREPLRKQPPSRETLFRLSGDALTGANPPRKINAFVSDFVEDVRGPLLEAIIALRQTGAAFDFVGEDQQGRHLEVTGSVFGAGAFISVLDITLREQAARDRQDAAVTAADLAARQSDILDHAPYLQWRMDAAGTVVWSNLAAMQQRGLHPVIPGLLAQRAHRLTIGETAEQHRMSVQPDDEAAPIWFDVTLVAREDGVILGYAIAADRIMRAEAALSRFVETLTETFAHLPIGLAIFDRDRELGLFNPALADLLRLDPAWLAGRPTLASFLNHLRERRALPDQRDFRQWREQLITLGRDGGTQDFAEVWVQPSGRTLRVVGRPHPQGAVAFLLEDITPAVTLEQQFREGMTLRAAALDARPGTHLIFDISGAAGFVGADFSKLMGVPVSADNLASAGAIHEVLRHCRATFGAAPIWDRVLSYVVGRASETERTPMIVPLQRDGQVLSVLELHPLPGGGTLLSFLPPTAVAEVPNRSLRRAVDLALEQARNLTEPADISVAVADDGAGQLPCTQQDLIRRAGYNMLLAAVDVVPAGHGVTLDLSHDEAQAILTLRADVSLADSNEIGATLPISLLRRYLSDVQGQVDVVEGESLCIQVRIPRAALAGRDVDGPVQLMASIPAQ